MSSKTDAIISLVCLILVCLSSASSAATCPCVCLSLYGGHVCRCSSPGGCGRSTSDCACTSNSSGSGSVKTGCPRNGVCKTCTASATKHVYPCGKLSCACGRPRCDPKVATCKSYCANASKTYCDDPSSASNCCGCNNSPCCKGAECGELTTKGSTGCPTCCDNNCARASGTSCGTPVESCTCDHRCCYPGNSGCGRCLASVLGCRCARCIESSSSNCNATNWKNCFCGNGQSKCSDPNCTH